MTATARRPTFGQQLSALVADLRAEGLPITVAPAPIRRWQDVAFRAAPVRHTMPVVYCANCGATSGVTDGYCSAGCRDAASWLHECGDCNSTGYAEEYDPQSPYAGTDGYAMVVCGCPAGDDMQALADSEDNRDHDNR